MTGTENPDGYELAATDFLTEARLRSARPKACPYKLRDGGGLYLLVTPTGAKQWRLRYTLGGRESMVSLGTYPATSLKAARAKRGSLRSALEAGRDPAAERRAERDSRSNTFESIAREWLAKQPFALKTMKKAVWTFEDLLFPDIGARPVSALTVPELLGVFRRLERRGKHETAHRAKQRVGQVVRYAIASGRAERDPTADVRGALAPVTAALRRMGNSGDQMSWHGFRAMASTLPNATGYPPDASELQLAHQERNEVRAAYNRAQRLDERRKMMQAWADYLDGLRTDATVVPFRRRE